MGKPTGVVTVGPADAFIVRFSHFLYRYWPSSFWLRSEREYENFVLRFEYKTEGWMKVVFSLYAIGWTRLETGAQAPSAA